MSSFEMASMKKLSYQRLIREDGYESEDKQEQEGIEDIEIDQRKRRWFRFKRLGSKKRSKLKIPSLRKFLRKKARLFSNVKISWIKVLKRLKESKSHFGDIFAGNYLLMQVTPSSLKYVKNKYSFTTHGLPSTPRYSLGS